MDQLVEHYNQTVRDFQAIEREIAARAINGKLPSPTQKLEYEAAQSAMLAADSAMFAATQKGN